MTVQSAVLLLSKLVLPLLLAGRPPRTHMAAGDQGADHVEVEVRFAWDVEVEQRIAQLAKEPPSRTSIDDVYLDAGDAAHELTLKNLWLRRRQGRYELKHPISVNEPSVYTETRDEQEIVRVLNAALSPATPLSLDGGSLEDALAAAGIAPFASLRTDRVSYDIDGGAELGRVHVDLDLEVSLNERVGELELCLPAGSAEEAVSRTRAALEAFAHEQLGVEARASGGNKLLAHIRAHDPEHFSALMAMMKQLKSLSPTLNGRPPDDRR